MSQSHPSITGRVIDAADQLPIPFATIQVREYNYYTLSDGKGFFHINNITYDSLHIEVSFVGYSPEKIRFTKGESRDTVIIMLRQQLINMEEVVVTATRSERLLKDVPVATQIITSRQMEATGVTNIADIINTLRPGVDFYNEGRGMTFRLQGLAAKYALFLIDGERIAGENRDNIDYSRLVSGYIDRVEIVQGASSSLYGSSAMGGVVNLITKTPSSPFESEIYTRVSKFSDIEAGANIGTKQEGWSYFADFVRKSSDGYNNTPQTPDIYTVEPHETYSFFNKAVMDISDKLQLDARFSLYSRERFDVADIPKHPYYTDFSSGLRLKYKPGTNISHSVSAYRDAYNSFDILERRNNERLLNYNNTQLSLKYISDIKINPDGKKFSHHITSGIDYLHDEMFASRIQDSVKSNNNLSLFLQDEIKINQNFSFVAGIRSDFNDDFGSALSPKASMMYKVGQMIYRASVARGFRTPGIKERYYDFDLGFIVVKGNENLLPEESFYTSVSAEYLTSSTNVSIIAYNNNLKDMIMEFPVEGFPNHYTYQNFSSVNIYGTDLFFRSRLPANLSATAGYSFIHAIDMETGQQLNGVSRHSGTVSLNYLRRVNYGSIGLNLHGKIYGQKDFINLDESTALFFDDKYETYSIWRFSVLKRVLNNSITVNAGIDNLFNYKTNTDIINIDPGRRFFVGLNFSPEKVYNHIRH